MTYNSLKYVHVSSYVTAGFHSVHTFIVIKIIWKNTIAHTHAHTCMYTLFDNTSNITLSLCLSELCYAWFLVPSYSHFLLMTFFSITVYGKSSPALFKRQSDCKIASSIYWDTLLKRHQIWAIYKRFTWRGVKCRTPQFKFNNESYWKRYKTVTITILFRCIFTAIAVNAIYTKGSGASKFVSGG